MDQGDDRVVTSRCPGCGLVLVAEEGAVGTERINASRECQSVNGEVAAFELARPWLGSRCHQLQVDAYGAQHAGGPTKPIRVAYSLVGLHLALDRGLPGPAVREAHARMGKPGPDWPSFERPAGALGVTVLDVARAGAWADSVEGHAEAVDRWARAVWEWWDEAHGDVEHLTRMVLGDWLARRG